MKRETAKLPSGVEFELITLNTVVIGSGAAGLNCAEHLWELGQRDIALVTDRLGGGASANSGSDKQTYYKIGIFGDAADSPMDFARTLTEGGMMHGDLAYVEALGSAPEFFHLVRNGVPFPRNRYGAYVGYKTDFDPRQRATSAGPKTSVLMVGKSLEQLRRCGVALIDRCEIIALLAAGEGEDRRVVGAVALDLSALDEGRRRLVVFNCTNVVMATGGPGEMYAASVYPPGQIGSHGLALEIGAVANNLTESQFGLASVGFRWNLSGTYQQVIPRYFSTDADGGESRDFLADWFESTRRMATCIFLKGYQWPFSPRHVEGRGSSIVDLAVDAEIAAGRRVFMDFSANPASAGEFALGDLEPEARDYLERCGATQATPYERLAHANPYAIDVFREHGVDLREPLEVAVCAQHNNGGLKGGIWWESNLKRLFPIGEVNGTHGVRPGGSALNSGQVGGLRAAQYISSVYGDPPPCREDFLRMAGAQIGAAVARLDRHAGTADSATGVMEVRCEIQQRMTKNAAYLRSADGVAKALGEAKRLRSQLATEGMRLASLSELPLAVQNEHLCLTHVAFLESLNAYIERGGGSRGCFLVLDEAGDCSVELPGGGALRYRSENVDMRKEILEVSFGPGGDCTVEAVPVRPLPGDDSWYETTWAEWRSGDIYRQ